MLPTLTIISIWLLGHFHLFQAVTLGEYLAAELSCYNAVPRCNCTSIRIPPLLGLQGTVPHQISECELLEDLDLSFQSLTGGLPPSLPASLQTVALNHNLLNETLASLLASLPSHLTELFANDNAITGTLPSNAFHILPNIIQMSLDNNKLSGSIPSTWCDSSNLSRVSLHENKNICGELSTCFTTETTGSGIRVHIHHTGAFESGMREQALAPGGNTGLCPSDLPDPHCHHNGCGAWTSRIQSTSRWISFNVSVPQLQNTTRSLQWGLETLSTVSPESGRAIRPSSEIDPDSDTIQGLEWSLVGSGLQQFWPEVEDEEHHIWSDLEDENGRILHIMKVKFPGMRLIDGVTYRVVVERLDLAGPPQVTTIHSDPFQVDSSAPNTRKVSWGISACALATQPRQQDRVFSEYELITACWPSFEEEHSAIEYYEVRILRLGGEDSVESLQISADVSGDTEELTLLGDERRGGGEDNITGGDLESRLGPLSRMLSMKCSVTSAACTGEESGEVTWTINLNITASSSAVNTYNTLKVDNFVFGEGDEFLVGVTAVNTAGLKSRESFTPLGSTTSNTEESEGSYESDLMMFGYMLLIIFTTCSCCMIFLRRLFTVRHRAKKMKERWTRYQRACNAVNTAYQDICISSDMRLTGEFIAPGQPRTNGSMDVTDYRSSLSIAAHSLAALVDLQAGSHLATHVMSKRGSGGTITSHMGTNSQTFMSPYDHVNHKSDVVFVVTDLMDSTPMAKANPKAYWALQRTHDDVLRKLLRRHPGYEIATQGDSFELAFTDVATAVLFCLEVQEQLVQADWSEDVLQLPSCGVEVDESKGGALVFAGPRVRMGIHYARHGTFTREVHDLTRTTVYHGPAFELTQSVSDSAHGGQILMTSDAMVELVWRDCGYPTVESVGMFHYEGHVEDVEILQVSPGLGSMGPKRTFPLSLRNATFLKAGYGLNVGMRPMDLEHVAVVTMKLGGSHQALLPGDQQTLVHVVCSVAQAIGGEVIQVYDAEGYGAVGVLFESAVRGCEFACVCQVALVHANWSESLVAYAQEREVRDFQGGILFRGPRIAIAVRYISVSEAEIIDSIEGEELCDELCFGNGFIHSRAINSKFFRNSKDVVQLLHSLPRSASHADVESGRKTLRERRHEGRMVKFLKTKEENVQRSIPILGKLCTLEGAQIEPALDLCGVVHGGQIVIGQHAWQEMQSSANLGGVQILDLGMHLLTSEHAAKSDMERGELIMEVTPDVFANRDFPQLKTFKCLSPGFREAPTPEDGIVIVFCKASPMGSGVNDALPSSAAPSRATTGKRESWTSETDQSEDIKQAAKRASLSKASSCVGRVYSGDGDGFHSLQAEKRYYEDDDAQGFVSTSSKMNGTPKSQLTSPPKTPMFGGQSETPNGLENDFTNNFVRRNSLDDTSKREMKDQDRWCNLCRDTLPQFDGYWCKEVDGSKFTLAFSRLEDALSFCVEVQLKLLEPVVDDIPGFEGDWEVEDRTNSAFVVREELMKRSFKDFDVGGSCIDEDREQEEREQNPSRQSSHTDSAQGLGLTPLVPKTRRPSLNSIGEHSTGEPRPWDLKVAMGLAYGTKCFKKHLPASGRADYFGPLANLAARVMGQASPGQILLRGNQETIGEWPGPSEAQKYQDSIPGTVAVPAHGGSQLSLRFLGKSFLKGIGATPLISVTSEALEHQQQMVFPLPKSLVEDCHGTSVEREKRISATRTPRRKVIMSMGRASSTTGLLGNTRPEDRSMPSTPKSGSRRDLLSRVSARVLGGVSGKSLAKKDIY